MSINLSLSLKSKTSSLSWAINLILRGDTVMHCDLYITIGVNGEYGIGKWCEIFDGRWLRRREWIKLS